MSSAIASTPISRQLRQLPVGGGSLSVPRLAWHRGCSMAAQHGEAGISEEGDEVMTIRTQIKAGAPGMQHNETLQVRSGASGWQDAQAARDDQPQGRSSRPPPGSRRPAGGWSQDPWPQVVEPPLSSSTAAGPVSRQRFRTQFTITTASATGNRDRAFPAAEYNASARCNSRPAWTTRQSRCGIASGDDRGVTDPRISGTGLRQRLTLAA